MNKKAPLLISVLAVIVSFVGGFLLANAINRNDLEDLRAENARLKSAPDENADSAVPELTDEEIRQKINEADQNPTNFDFQKNLAIGLYRYAGMKQEARYLTDVARLLRRAHEINPKNHETIVALGNVYLDLGQLNKDNQSIAEAREFYRRALNLKKDDADVQNDLGLTYFFADPPEFDKAVAEYLKALQMNPKHEKSLENLVRANLSLGKNDAAEEFIGRLKQINPSNKNLPDLEAQLAESQNKQ